MSHYHILRERGAVEGETYLARNTRLGRQVARKFLRRRTSTIPTAGGFLKKPERFGPPLLISPHLRCDEHEKDLHLMSTSKATPSAGSPAVRSRKRRRCVAAQVPTRTEAHSFGIIHCDITSRNLT